MEFKNPLISMPNFSPNNEFNFTIEGIVKKLPNISIKRDNVQTILSQIDFDVNIEEEFPFTRNLFDDLELLFKDSDIKITELKHQQYKERYTFKRNNEIVVLDFEYKKNGFFGRIVPIYNLVNSQSLLTFIQTALQTFKIIEDAS
jgi:hypothetical protein